MNKHNKRIEKIIYKYGKDDTAMLDLSKIYNSYNQEVNLDNETKKLYNSYMRDLTSNVIIRKEYKRTLVFTIISMILTIGLCLFYTYNYVIKKSNLKDNIIRASSNSSLIVNYNNIDNSIIMVLNNDDGYELLEPLNINLENKSLSSNDKKLRYNVYINPVIEDNMVDLSTVKLSIKDNDKETFKILGNSYQTDSKYLIYSNTIGNNEKKDLDIRMWLTELNINKYSLKYKFYVESFIE